MIGLACCDACGHCKRHSQCDIMFVHTNHCPQSHHFTQHTLDSIVLVMTQMYLCASCEVNSRDLESMSVNINKSHQHIVSCCSVVWVLRRMVTSSFFTTRWFGRVLSHMDTLPNSPNHWESTMTQWKKSLRRHCVSNEYSHDTSSFHFSNHEPV